jgi:hypothetical protein
LMVPSPPLMPSGGRASTVRTCPARRPAGQNWTIFDPIGI